MRIPVADSGRSRRGSCISTGGHRRATRRRRYGPARVRCGAVGRNAVRGRSCCAVPVGAARASGSPDPGRRRIANLDAWTSSSRKPPRLPRRPRTLPFRRPSSRPRRCCRCRSTRRILSPTIPVITPPPPPPTRHAIAHAAADTHRHAHSDADDSTVGLRRCSGDQHQVDHHRLWKRRVTRSAQQDVVHPHRDVPAVWAELPRARDHTPARRQPVDRRRPLHGRGVQRGAVPDLCPAAHRARWLDPDLSVHLRRQPGNTPTSTSAPMRAPADRRSRSTTRCFPARRDRWATSSR